jgi:hypothetical protein
VPTQIAAKGVRFLFTLEDHALLQGKPLLVMIDERLKEGRHLLDACQDHTHVTLQRRKRVLPEELTERIRGFHVASPWVAGPN